MGIKAPRILFENHFIVYSIVKGKSMYEFLKETKNLELVRKIAFIKGTELAKIHKNGYAFVDNKVANTIITQKLELYSIDHEFFCFKAKKFQRELDFITLAATLPSNVFHEFWKSFCLGYKKIRKEIPKIERKDMLGIGMIGFTLMHLFGFL